METKNNIGNNVNHPSHYGGENNPYETIKVLKAWGLDGDAYLWNAVKYLSRAGHKENNSLLQDMMKARWYIDYKIKLLQGYADSLQTKRTVKATPKCSCNCKECDDKHQCDYNGEEMS